MAFKRLEFGKTWRNHDDFPTYQDSEAQVREDLQYHPDAILSFLNDTFMKELEQEGAKHIGAGDSDEDGNVDTLETVLANIDSELSRLDDDLKNLAGGETPEAMRSKTVTFTAEDWTATGDSYVLAIPRSSHGRASAAFGCQLWMLDNGVYRSDVWTVAGTTVRFVASSFDILMDAEEPYEGMVAFFGV